VTDRPRCALCLAILGTRAADAHTYVGGTAVCVDHVGYLLDPELVATVRADVEPWGMRPVRPSVQP
jgi:hypothetical protein